jgi:tetratricopeptide (TPR) repeat protein
MRRLDLAAAEAQRGLDRHPHDPQLLGQLAALHLLGRNRPKAAQLCQEWLKYDPNAAEPYRLLAQIAREEGRLPEAQRLGEQALARDPQNAKMAAGLAKTLGAIGGPSNLRRAVELARQATALNPHEGDYWHTLGTLLRSAGDPAGAADALLRALDLDRTASAACGELVPTASQQNRPQTARLYATLATELQNSQRTTGMLWDAVYRRSADPDARARLARALLAAGELRRAGYQLEELASLRPADRAARRDLALVRRLLDLRGE